MAISDEDRVLLETHAPQLRYHPREAYRADSAATFTEAYSPGRHSNELRAKSGKLVAKVRPTAGVARLSLATLAPRGKEYYPGGDKAAKGDYLLGHAKTLRDDWLAARRLPGLADRVYCRIAEGAEGRRWLQYWFFFYDNPFQRFGFGQHQGDWEWIQIALVDGKPDRASYSQHGQSESRDWPKVPTVGGKGVVPVVYVAKDSHALYYKADEHTRIFGFANDHTADGGVRLRPEPYILDERGEDDWIRWPGTWGPPEGSPTGPPSKTAWKDPEAFHADRVKRGLLAGLEEVPLPAAPELAVTLDEDTAVVSYTLAPRTPGGSDPARLELALYGASPRPVPSVAVVDITEARGQVRVPLPYDDGPYELHAAVYDAEDQETLLAPIEVAVPRGAGLEAAPPRVLRPEPPARRPVALSEVGLIATAPADDDAGRVTLEQAARRADVLGPSVAVTPLFHGDDPALRRHFVVRGAPTEAPRTDVAGAAFEAARRLRSALPDEWEVLADPPGAAATPTLDRAEAALGNGDDPHDWAIEEVCCPQAWKLSDDRGAKGAGILIAQPDTGFTDHPELELGALDRLRDYDVLTGRDDAHAVLRGFPPFAFPSHGTGTASVAVSREAGDITGAAPQAIIVPIRAAESVIHVRNAELALAVERAYELGADVIAISMGGVLYPPPLQAIIARAVAAGTIVMAAAGQFVGPVVWPARFPECLAVGGSARFGKPWRWSSKGPEVDISAPAKDVWVAATRSRGADPFHIAQHDGTSFAVALTAGVAALWLAHHGGREKVAAAVGGMSNVQAAFRALVRRECTRPDGWDTGQLGSGLVNAEKLLAAELESWTDAADEPARPLTDAEGRALEAAAVMAPDDVDAEERMVGLFGGDRSRLALFGDEVVYRMAADEELRAAVLSTPGAGLEANGPALLRAVASPSLREALAQA